MAGGALALEFLIEAHMQLLLSILIQGPTQPVAPPTPYFVEFVKGVGPTATAILALLATVVYNRKSIRQRQQEILETLRQKTDEADRTFHLKRNEDRRAEITRQLNDFYGPMRQLLGISDVLHRKFKNGRKFRTLTRLLQGTRFEGNDKVLLDEIMRVTQQIQELIQRGSGVVTDEELRSTLATAGAHFSILRLAAAQELTGEPERFADVVFPERIRPLVNREIDRLQEELRRLRMEAVETPSR